MAYIKTSLYKDMTDALGRFATTREKATGPQALIGVQNRAGKLKLISGNSRAVMVVDVPEHTSLGDGSFAINARPFLQGAKVLPARSEVEIVVGPNRLEVVTQSGGKIELASEMSLNEAGFPKKPRTFYAKGDINGKDWKRLSRMFKSVSAKVEVPSVQIVGDTGYATSVAPGNRPKYASYLFPAIGQDGYNMAAYLDFWEGLSGLEKDGSLKWGTDGVMAVTDGVTCYSAPYLVSRYDPETRTAETPREAPAWPIMKASGKTSTSFSMDRRNLIDIVKGQAPFDELNRVTLEVDIDSIRVTPFGKEAGQQVPAASVGHGIRSVNAEYLNSLLSSMDTKEVTLGWGSGQPAISITSEDYTDWTILLAPVAL